MKKEMYLESGAHYCVFSLVLLLLFKTSVGVNRGSVWMCSAGSDSKMIHNVNLSNQWNILELRVFFSHRLNLYWFVQQFSSSSFGFLCCCCWKPKELTFSALLMHEHSPHLCVTWESQQQFTALVGRRCVGKVTLLEHRSVLVLPVLWSPKTWRVCESPSAWAVNDFCWAKTRVEGLPGMQVWSKPTAECLTVSLFNSLQQEEKKPNK